MSDARTYRAAPTATVRSADGTVIAYNRLGEGPALVNVDGAFCTRNFGPAPGLASILAADFTVYTYDRRGRGDSTDTQPFAVEREIEDLDAVIAAAGSSAYVFGSSSGSALALRAVASGSPITRLALWEAPYTTDPGQTEAYETYKRELETLLAEDRLGDAVALFMVLIGSPSEAIAGMRQAPVWPALEALAPTLAYDAVVLGDRSIPAKEAAMVGIPTLVLDGGASPESMRNGNRALARAINGAHYKTLDGQNHEVAPDVLATELKEFFAT